MKRPEKVSPTSRTGSFESLVSRSHVLNPVPASATSSGDKSNKMRMRIKIRKRHFRVYRSKCTNHQCLSSFGEVFSWNGDELERTETKNQQPLRQPPICLKELA